MAIWQDIRYGARSLRKAPGFTLTAVATLALGIGATTAIFSVSDALLWKPVPLPRLDPLVMVLQRVPDDPRDFNSISPADVEDIRSQLTSLDGMASWDDGLANIVPPGGEPQRVYQYLVTANFFDVVGVQPALGRGFRAGEDQPGREREVVLSDTVWRNRFGADPAIVGQSLRLDDENYTVIGVMPPKFTFPRAAEIWTPLALTAEARSQRRSLRLDCVGRLKPGATLERTIAELEALAGSLAKLYPETNRTHHFTAITAHRFLVGDYTRDYMRMLLGSVLFVLLIACVNVANLQFARATGRVREVALRTALGARRWRVVSQLVTESVLVGLAGAALGLLVAHWGLNLIRAGMPAEVERWVLGWKEIHLDTRALIFTLTAAVGSGILAGLAPAWQFSRPNLNECLKEGGRGTSAGRGRSRLRAALVGGEIALAVVLLVGASLMVRGFERSLASGESLQPGSLLTLRLALTEAKYREPHQVAAFYRQALERIGAVPGVRSAAAVSSMPYSQHSSRRPFSIEGRPLDPARIPSGMYQAASPSYFQTLHVPLRAGRYLAAGDGPDAPRVAVVSEALARQWWPGQPLPVGRRIRIGLPESPGKWTTIVGVVGDVRHDIWDRDPRAVLYIPFVQEPTDWMDLGVRAEGDPLRLASAVTAAIRSLDPEAPVSDVFTMSRLIRNDATAMIYVAVLMGVFGVLALVLSSIGVYGVMAYLVSEQTHEIGVRIALGASAGEILGTVFRRGMTTALAGLALGLGAAYGMARLLASLVFGVTATDPATFLAIPAALIASAALAIYVPARRAMKVDPIAALRYE